MMENQAMSREFNWDDVIEHDSEFVLLPEGDYDFTVKSFERARHPGSAKLPPCNKAVLSIEVTNGEAQATISHSLFLHSRCEGMLCEFFTAIGQRKRGEPLRMNWNQVAGSRGRCKVIVDSFTSSKTGETLKSNKIRKFYAPQGAAPDESSAPAAPSAPVAPSAPAAQQTGFGGGFGGGGFGAGRF